MPGHQLKIIKIPSMKVKNFEIGLLDLVTNSDTICDKGMTIEKKLTKCAEMLVSIWKTYAGVSAQILLKLLSTDWSLLSPNFDYCNISTVEKY